MKMTPKAVVIGSLLILAAVVFVAVLLPYADTNKITPSEIFRARSADETSGRQTYIANGCVYCHSQSILFRRVYPQRLHLARQYH